MFLPCHMPPVLLSAAVRGARETHCSDGISRSALGICEELLQDDQSAEGLNHTSVIHVKIPGDSSASGH